MSDKRHRGSHPADRQLFGPDQVPVLREAVGDLSWLLGRGYAETAALKLVGDRYQLTRRQRTGIMRSACTDAQRASRAAREVVSITDEAVIVDGFNTLITLERLLGGGLVLRGRDRALRDLAGVHGTWRSRVETEAAIRGIVSNLSTAERVHILFDRPVSNSGRLAERFRQAAPHWQVDVHESPDAVLAASDAVVITSDAGILDPCRRWHNLLGRLAPGIQAAWVVDLE